MHIPPLRQLSLLENCIALACLTLPFWLILADGFQVRPSISNYMYMKHSYLFGMLLATAGMLFIVNGVVYMRKGDYHYTYKKHGRWYNLVLGLALMGVILFPHLEYPLPHYLSAGIFFGGSALVIAIFCNPEHRAISIAIAVASLAALAVHFACPGVISLFWAEWISLAVIAVHYFLESIRVLSE